jgi:hypothetical protein
MQPQGASPTSPATGTLSGMPVPTPRCKDDAAADLDHHAELHWSQLGGVEVRWRGGYGYVIGYLDDDETDLDAPEETVPLCRIGYLGAANDWAFALYDPATDSYQDTVLPDGSFTGTLQDILDCACRIHLADIPSRPIQP